MAAALAPGFADPVFDAQRIFRAVMNALARPGSVQSLDATLQPPSALPLGLAAIALTLADHEAPLWLDRTLAATPDVAAYLRFHTGAAIVEEPAQAGFALVADGAAMPGLERFAIGSLEYPDRSTTLVVNASSVRAGAPMRMVGPGIETEAVLRVDPLPPDFIQLWNRNGALFPRGIDILFATGSEVVGLPRTSRIISEA